MNFDDLNEYEDPTLYMFEVGPGELILKDSEGLSKVTPSQLDLEAIDEFALNLPSIFSDIGLATYVDEDYIDVIDSIKYHNAFISNGDIFLTFTASIAAEDEDLQDTIEEVKNIILGTMRSDWGLDFKANPIKTLNNKKLYYNPWIKDQTTITVKRG